MKKYYLSDVTSDYEDNRYKYYDGFDKVFEACYHDYLEEIKSKEYRLFLELEDREISEKVDLANLMYTYDINDISQYAVEGIESYYSEYANDDCIYAMADEFTEEEQDYILHGWDYIDEDYMYTEEELKGNIIKKMKENHFDPETYKVYEYFDGSNLKEIVLESENYEVFYKDVTDEFEGMELIDTYQGSTSIERLFKLKDGSKVLIEYSFFQGTLPTLKYIDSDIENIETFKEREADENEEYQ